MKTATPLLKPIDAIVFDCDGTLSSIEGIDELAKEAGVSDRVEKLTAKAMGLTGLNADLYRQRLNLVTPHRDHLLQLAQIYYDHKTPDILEVISTLKRLNKSIYIVSAGILLPVTTFGQRLGVKPENIFAVDVSHDTSGNYVDFDGQSPLIDNQGKRQIISHLQSIHTSIAFIGDGLNDLAVKDLVTRFIGFGGFYYRKNIAEKCDFYIHAKSLAPLLELILTPQERILIEV